MVKFSSMSQVHAVLNCFIASVEVQCASRHCLGQCDCSNNKLHCKW